jgi:hypothetical protein
MTHIEFSNKVEMKNFSYRASIGLDEERVKASVAEGAIPSCEAPNVFPFHLFSAGWCLTLQGLILQRGRGGYNSLNPLRHFCQNREVLYIGKDTSLDQMYDSR